TPEIQKAKSCIEYVDGKVLGVVLNRTKDKRISKAYKNYAKEKDKERAEEIKKRKKDQIQFQPVSIANVASEEAVDLCEKTEQVKIAVEDETDDNTTDGQRILL
ncbi:MAG: hypothetical protein RR309_12255, partial [Cellulosilyticaceae bacterium]